MSKQRIDITREVSIALSNAGVASEKKRILQNEIVQQLETLEGIDRIEITKDFVSAVAGYVQQQGLTNFSVDNLEAVMREQGISRPTVSQETGAGLKESIEKELAAHFYDTSERYGTSYKDIADNKEDAKPYQTLVPEIAQRIRNAYTKGNTLIDITALQELVSDLCNVNIGEGMIILSTKRSDLSPDRLELNSTKRFNLMAQEAARRALSQHNVTDPARVQQLADTIIEAGSGFKKLGGDLFRDFHFASRSDIGKSTTPIKMLHELPEIQDIAQRMASEPDYGPQKKELSTELDKDKEKYIFGRKEIAKASVTYVVEEAVGESIKDLAKISKDPYLKAAAEYLKSKMSQDVSDSFAKKLKSELVREFMNNHISTKARADGSKMTINDLSARLAHPVGQNLLRAAVSEKLLARRTTLETVSKGLFDQIADGWVALKEEANRKTVKTVEKVSKKLGITSDWGVVRWLEEGKKMEAGTLAKGALENFLAFDPDDKNTYPAADKLKVDTNKEIAGRAERFTQASQAVDLMVTTEMRENRLQPKFNLHPRVRERLVRYLYENPELDQVAFSKSLCDNFMQRGRANKTFTLAHFEPKGDRTQGTWKEFFRKCVQKFRKLFASWPELPSLFTPSAAAFENVLGEVKNIVKTGITPPRVYSSHRDAQAAVIEAVKVFNRDNRSPSGTGLLVEKRTLPDIAIDKDVRAALVKQVTIELEKARVEGKKIFMDDIIAGLQPGMKELAKKGRDGVTGEITAKTVKDSALSALSDRVIPGYEKPVTQASQSLEDFCKEVVGKKAAVVLGDYSIGEMGRTRSEVQKAVLEHAMADVADIPGKKEVKKALEKAVDAALKEYDEKSSNGIYTQDLITELQKVAKSSIQTDEIPPKKEGQQSTYKLVVKDGLDKQLSDKVTESADLYSEKIFGMEEKQRLSVLEHVRKYRTAPEYVKITSEGAEYYGYVGSESQKLPEDLLPTLNSAKAFFEYIVSHSKTKEGKDYCRKLTNDPKYAEVLFYSRFQDNDGFHPLPIFLKRNDLVDQAVIDIVEAREKELLACSGYIKAGHDIKVVAENINAMKKAGVFKVGADNSLAPQAKEIMTALVEKRAIVVEGVADKPVIVEGSAPEVRAKAEQLLRFLNNHKNEKPEELEKLTAEFIRVKKFEASEIRDSKVSGQSLTDFVKSTHDVNLTLMRTDARTKAVSEIGEVVSANLDYKRDKEAKALADERERLEREQEARRKADKKAHFDRSVEKRARDIVDEGINRGQSSVRKGIAAVASVIRKVPYGSTIVGEDPRLERRPDATPGKKPGDQGRTHS
jgi:hypothetical protein